MKKRMGPTPAALVATVLLAFATALVAEVLAAPDQARAAYPGQNGKIVYVKDTCGEGCAGLYAKTVGEAAPVALTDDSLSSEGPSYTHGGERIVYSRYDGIFAIPSSGGTPELLAGNGNGPISFSHPSLSPDGKTLLYEGFNTDTRQSAGIYVVPVSGGSPKLIAGDDDGGYYGSPEWSPDGRRISYYRSGTIWTIPASGGVPDKVTDAAFEGDHSWSPDATRIAFLGYDSVRNLDVLYTVSSGGGTPRPVYQSNTGHLRSPAYSPDGRFVAFVDEEPAVAGAYASDEIFVVPSGGGSSKQVTFTEYGAGQPDWQPVCPCPEPNDVTEPTITRPRPAPSTLRGRTATVGATVQDETSELEKSDIRLYLDGAPKAFSYDPDTDRLSSTTSRLSYGRHHIMITATDAAGNRAVRKWSFQVAR